MTLFRDTPEFGPTLDAAGERLGISPTAVEKDYWVSQILRRVNDEHPGDFIFKGGTSLSKGYRLVERFSEDIDVLVVPGTRGRNATDTLMKNMAACAAAAAGGDAEPAGSSETGRHRSYEISYPASRAPTALIRTSVLLEMGIRGGPQPHELVALGSLLGDVLADAGTDLEDFEDLTPFDVAVLHPGRTLLEKLAMIHALARQLEADPSTQIPARNGRHFYDVHQLLGDERVQSLLSEPEEVRAVIASIEEVNQRYFPSVGGEVRPAGGFATCPAFSTDSDISAKLRAGYESTMPELYFGTDPLPSWQDICERVIDHAHLL